MFNRDRPIEKNVCLVIMIMGDGEHDAVDTGGKRLNKSKY